MKDFRGAFLLLDQIKKKLKPFSLIKKLEKIVFQLLLNHVFHQKA
jgi:hypothetical protein